MKFTLISTLLIFSFSIGNAWAAIVTVPEIDGANAVLGLGLTAGIIAFIRERGRKK